MICWNVGAAAVQHQRQKQSAYETHLCFVHASYHGYHEGTWWGTPGHIKWSCKKHTSMFHRVFLYTSYFYYYFFSFLLQLPTRHDFMKLPKAPRCKDINIMLWFHYSSGAELQFFLLCEFMYVNELLMHFLHFILNETKTKNINFLFFLFLQVLNIFPPPTIILDTRYLIMMVDFLVLAFYHMWGRFHLRRRIRCYQRLHRQSSTLFWPPWDVLKPNCWIMCIVPLIVVNKSNSSKILHMLSCSCPVGNMNLESN